MRQTARRVAGLSILKRLRPSGPGFLTLERLVVRNRYAGGRLSRPYRFEAVHRRGLDSVAIMPFFFSGKRLMVILKEGFRPALYLRRRLRPPIGARSGSTRVLEAVAGSLEPGDRGHTGIDRRALAELAEETGLRPARRALTSLGAGFFPSHGQSSEKVHLRAARVDPRRAKPPGGDGSVNEADSGLLSMEARAILRACRTGRIEDPKIEIGVTRLCRRLRYRID